MCFDEFWDYATESIQQATPPPLLHVPPSLIMNILDILSFCSPRCAALHVSDFTAQANDKNKAKSQLARDVRAAKA